MLKTIDDVLNYIETTVNVVRSYFDGKPQRQDEFLLDKDAVREAWVNACVHNDYTTHLGASIYLFSDHLSIFSNGNALKNISREKFLKGISRPVNPELAKICMRLEYVEESGKGINTIVNKYGEDVFEFDDTYLQVNIPFNKKALELEHNLEKVTDKVADKVADKLSKNEQKILNLIDENSQITIIEISKKLGLSDSGVRKIIASLKNMGTVKRIGSNKSGYWKIIK